MKNNIFGKFKVFLILVAAVLICLPFLKQMALRQVKDNYLKEFVKIKQQNSVKSNAGSSAKITVVIDNSGDMILDRVPFQISYLSAEKTIISVDRLDLLKKVKDVILAHSSKTFEIDVTIPKGCRFISPQIIY